MQALTAPPAAVLQLALLQGLETSAVWRPPGWNRCHLSLWRSTTSCRGAALSQGPQLWRVRFDKSFAQVGWFSWGRATTRTAGNEPVRSGAGTASICPLVKKRRALDGADASS